jgi:hypothetical protein
MKKFFLLLLAACLVQGAAFAKNEDTKSLPQGLQKKLDRGATLPPGWERKLVRGAVMEESIFRESEIVIPVDRDGLLTVRIEGKLIKLVEATREILEVVELLN